MLPMIVCIRKNTTLNLLLFSRFSFALLLRTSPHDEPSTTNSAVALMSSEPSLLQSRPSPFGKAPALAPLSFSKPKIGLAPLRSESVTVKKEWTGVTSSAIWNVKGEDLEQVPVDFPLERTHREIANVDASEVAARISSVLGALSIEAEYDDEKARAKCKTAEYVSFRIRLYSGGEAGQPVVVELQRRCGSASVFMKSCRAILCAAEGKDMPRSASSKTTPPPFLMTPVSQMKCLQSATVAPKWESLEDSSTAEIEKVLSMLRESRRDSNLLALENLCCLTDPVKTSSVVALQMSKYVALGDDKYDIRDEIREKMDRDVFTASEFDEDESAHSHIEHLRCLAFRSLANALEMCSKDGCLAAAVESQKWFDELIPSLLDELKMASTSATTAQEAASSLSSLLSCSDKASRVFSKHGGVDVVKEANAYGKQFHALLAEETGRCLSILK